MHALIDQILDDSSLQRSVHFLPSDLSIDILVPLAGVLLEYPAVYVPESNDQTLFLPGVPLDIYHCVLVFDTGHGVQSLPAGYQHTLLNFSCPVPLTNDCPDLAPEQIIRNLQARFTSRLQKAKWECSVHIYREQKTMDRVAL